jgi:hypothetical protein
MSEPSMDNASGSGGNAVVDMAVDMDQGFYRQFDPFYFFTLARAVSIAKSRDLRWSASSEGDVSDGDGENIQTKLLASQCNFDDYSSMTVRALRYFSAETLVLFLVAQPKIMPFARAVSKFQPRIFTEVFKSLAKREIPKALEPRLPHDLSFGQWVQSRKFQVALILSSVQDVRIARLSGRPESNLIIPKGFAVPSPIRRRKFAFSVTDKKGDG